MLETWDTSREVGGIWAAGFQSGDVVVGVSFTELGMLDAGVAGGVACALSYAVKAIGSGSKIRVEMRAHNSVDGSDAQNENEKELGNAPSRNQVNNI
jgi:hypothetical protein